MKRRFTVNVTKGYIITAGMFLLGVILLLWGFFSYLDFKKGQNALPISELEEYQIKDGQYVRGVIREYVGYYEIQGYETVFSSSAYGGVGFGGNTFYCNYTIKIANDKYINIYINDKDTALLRDLNRYNEGKGNSAYFEGKIVKNLNLPGEELEYEWYQKAFGIESKEEIDKLVISDYFILQDSFEIDTKKITIGFSFVILSIFYFFFSGGIKGLLVYWDEEEECE